jgi:signal peptidase I
MKPAPCGASGSALKRLELKGPPMADSEKQPEAKKSNFWDTLPGLVLLVIAILGARTYILEPYKIPSGSMEPTLFGHEDHGDRIVTNKLAYAKPSRVWSVIGGSFVVIVLCVFASKAWQRKSSIAFWVLMTLAIPGGLLWALMDNAVADEPRRFDVTVFQYNTEWSGKVPNEKINYIKRLWGLPGEELRISGGDVYLRKGTGYRILRKPEELQESIWFPVSSAWRVPPSTELSAEDKQKIRFPWDGAGEGTPGVKSLPHGLECDGSAPVQLEYKFPVSNIYLKQGRWPFRHVNCPAVAAQPVNRDEHGIVWHDAHALSEDFVTFIDHTSDGIVCPNCHQLLFPIVTDPEPNDPRIIDLPGTLFFYGGHQIVGDLRLDMDVDVAAGGTITLEVGSTLNHAVWTIGGTAQDEKAGAHPVTANTPALSPGRHELSLRYVDATVVALLDNKKVEVRELDLPIPAAKYAQAKSFVRVTLDGFKGELNKLDLYRDFFYLPLSEGSGMTTNQSDKRGIVQDGSGDYWAKIPEDFFMMLGDNSPSSVDSRIWGFVPESELIGRAGVVWWPPSRWRSINKSGPASAPADK